MDQFHFPDEISGFSRVEYLSVLISLLYAFAMAEFFEGWGKMIRQKDSITFSRDHLLWTFIYFWGAILNWFMIWNRFVYIGGSFVYFALTLFPILLFFLSVIILFPDLEKQRDMHVYYAKYQRIIILLFSLTLFFNIFIGILLKEFEWNTPINLVRGSISIIGIMAAVFNWKKLMNVLTYVFLVSIIAGTIIISMS